jgi:hypothetical protein
LHTYWLQTSEHSVNQQPDHQVKPSSYWGDYQKIDLRRQMMSGAARRVGCWNDASSLTIKLLIPTAGTAIHVAGRTRVV